MAKGARTASRDMAAASAETRVRALGAIADELVTRKAAVLDANLTDLAAARDAGLSAAMIDRLMLNDERIDAIAAAVREIASAPELVGRIERQTTRDDGLRIARMRIPLGVIAMIYESRPNVTIDAAALCIKSGNAVILRGGSEAAASNRALGEVARAGLRAASLPEDGVQVIATTDRAALDVLLTRSEEIDLVIPRGGEGLIRAVTEKSRIPVIQHYKGVCHLYVHEAADLEMALRISENAKVQRPGVCNAVETILVDAAIAPRFVPELSKRFADLGVEVRGDARARELGGPSLAAASEKDWDTEYLAKIVSLGVVDDFANAISHIEAHSSDHTESIITADKNVASEFLRLVNSSTVMVNASTRFADGGQLGLGAEIGISTTRLHAYGPMGAEGLTTTKFIVEGDGHVRD